MRSTSRVLPGSTASIGENAGAWPIAVARMLTGQAGRLGTWKEPSALSNRLDQRGAGAAVSSGAAVMTSMAKCGTGRCFSSYTLPVTIPLLGRIRLTVSPLWAMISDGPYPSFWPVR